METPLQEKISLLQLYILIILFQIGSAVVVGIGMEAKQDAWLAILIATGIGLGLTAMLLYILSLQEEKNLFEIFELTLGKYIAFIFTLIYVVYFFYIASRVLRDFLDLLKSVIYSETPVEFLAISLMLVVMYVIYLGIEVIARSAETFMPYIAIFLIIIAVFLVIGGDVRLNNLQPVLAEGFAPIWEAVFPGLIGFPFGEIIAITIIMAQTNKTQKQMRLVTMLAVLTTGLLLAAIKTLKITVLGIATIDRVTFPVLMVAREIAFADFIERIDALVIFVMMLGIFIKIALFFFGGLKGLEYMLKIPYRYFVIPMGLLITNSSILIAHNYAEHIEEGIQFVPMYLHLPLQIGIPIIIAIIVFFKKKKKRGEQTSA